MLGLGQAGQRETIHGGRDQDLLTPFWQTVALCILGAWALGWIVALALVIGPLLAYALSISILVARWRYVARRHREIPWQWLAWNVCGHAAIPVALDAWVWTGYILAWSAWSKMLWTILCALMIAPAALLWYVIVIRILDPNYPSPRKAMDQREPQMPWYRDAPAAQAAPTVPRLISVAVSENEPRFHDGRLDLPPVPEWYRFALQIIRHPEEFGETTAQRFGVKLDLKSNKPPWYGRGFRQVRNDILSRRWGRWVDDDHHKAGFILYAPALTAFRAYCEAGPPYPEV